MRQMRNPHLLLTDLYCVAHIRALGDSGMAIVNKLIEVASEATGVPLPTAVVYGRALREAGLLSQAGRGRAAAQATAADAAALLIALMVCPVAARAPDYVRDFGGLEQTTGPDAPTFCHELVSLIVALGDEAFAANFKPSTTTLLQRIAGSVEPPLETSVEIEDTALSATISLLGKTKEFGLDGPPGSIERLTAKAELLIKYQRGISSTKRVTSQVLLDIAACIHGCRFEDLVSRVSKEARG